MSQRKAVYEDLKAALNIMQLITDKTPTANVFYAMWLLENKQLTIGLNINVSFHYAHSPHRVLKKSKSFCIITAGS